MEILETIIEVKWQFFKSVFFFKRDFSEGISQGSAQQ